MCYSQIHKVIIDCTVFIRISGAYTSTEHAYMAIATSCRDSKATTIEVNRLIGSTLALYKDSAIRGCHRAVESDCL